MAALVAGAALMVSLSPAIGADAYELSLDEMDQVTAGATTSFTRTFILTDPLPPRREAGTVTLETPNGTLTGTFDVIFISFRAGGTHLDINRSIQTIATFD
jgi:hypothetical protein